MPLHKSISKKIISTTICFLLIVVSSVSLLSQENNKIIQFSGVVVENDSLKAIPFANIIIKNTWRGAMSDYYGFFSFVAHEGDTIMFSSMGFKKAMLIIPDSLTESRYSLIQILSCDTIILPESVIYPWPTKEQFKEAFLKLRIPDDDLERAKKNLALAEMKERARNMPMDGSMNYKNYMNNYSSKLYYYGQFPPNNLLNPFAWAQFIQAWRDGKFKQKR